MELTRRRLIGGIGLLLCAPTIVRASSIMPVRALKPDLFRTMVDEYNAIRNLSAFAGGVSYVTFDTWRTCYAGLLLPLPDFAL